MKFTCEKSVIQAAVAAASRAVSSKSTVPVLEGLLIETKGPVVLFTGYNLSMSICTTAEANVSKEGAVVINARMLGDIIRKMPDEPVTVETKDGQAVIIRSGYSEFNIIGLSPSDFPEIPAVDTKREISLAKKTLKSVIHETIFSVSENESKPVHTGSLFEIEGDRLTVVSVDGYRLALRRETVVKSGDEDFSFIVPGKALIEVERLADDSESSVSISLGNRYIVFQVGNTALVSRLLEGEFIKYDSAIPKAAKFSVKASRKTLCESIERVSLIISEQLKNPVRCIFSDGAVKLSCLTAVGRASDEVSIDGDGGELEIGFNHRYLLDALKNAPSDEVVLELSSNLSPCVILPPEGDSFLYLVLPVRLRAGE